MHPHPLLSMVMCLYATICVGVLFKYVSDFDANGILYWLGTAGN